jgi:hypothetical protein
MNAIHRVNFVSHRQKYILEIGFTDGKTFSLDFEPMVLNSKDDLTKPLARPEVFQQASCNGLTVEWPTGLDICPDGLREWCELGRVQSN